MFLKCFKKYMFSFKFIFQRFYDQNCSYTDHYYFD